MRVLAVDPAVRNTGYAIVETDGQNFRALDYGVLSIPAKHKQSRALAAVCTSLTNLIKKWEPDEVAVEAIIFVQSARTAISTQTADSALMNMRQRR